MTIRLMSDRELSRLEVLRDLDQKRLTTRAAGQLLGLERRQVFRLLKAYRIEGSVLAMLAILRVAPLLPSPMLRAVARVMPGRDGKAGSLIELESGV